jgi:hypothetical protein
MDGLYGKRSVEKESLKMENYWGRCESVFFLNKFR